MIARGYEEILQGLHEIDEVIAYYSGYSIIVPRGGKHLRRHDFAVGATSIFSSSATRRLTTNEMSRISLPANSTMYECI